MQKYEVTVDTRGTKFWYQNGKLHRLNGPAVEHADGSKFWYQNGMLHRLDGPAAEILDPAGYKAWYQNGKHHRLDGPAVEYGNGDKEWYINETRYSEAEFLAKTQPVKVKEMTMQQISDELGYQVKVVK